MRRIAVVLVGVLVGVHVLAGCGVPLDNSPQAISQNTVAVTEPTPTTIAKGGSQAVTVYFLNGDTLEGKEFPVDGDPMLSTALGFVLADPPDGSGDLRTRVPPGTELRSAEISGDTATIDLTSDINAVSSVAQKQAFAQLVFTALAFDGVEKVQFKVDGSAVDAPTDEGNVSVVTAGDYDKPLNPR